MLSASLPTLNAITALACNAIPCLVTHCSATSASRMASVRKLAWRTNGTTNAPCPVTTLNGVPFWPDRPPEMSIASSGAGTRKPNISDSSQGLQIASPPGCTHAHAHSALCSEFHHIEGAIPAGVVHQHLSPAGQRLL